MDEKTKQDLQKSLRDIAAPLQVLSLISLANEFYTPKERRALYAELTEINEAEKAAYDQVQATTPKDNEDPGKRRERIGAEAFDKERAPFMRAYEAKQETSRRWLKFMRDHPLIYKLYSHKSQEKT